MVRIEALVQETGLGVHTVSVHLLLYQALFLSCMLFNSQAWSTIKEVDIEKLEKIQLKWANQAKSVQCPVRKINGKNHRLRPFEMVLLL